MNPLGDNRLVKTFTDLRSADRKTLVPFITAGFPDMETTGALLENFESRGVKVCELGIPFSDPIVDGPVIQNSYTEALSCGVTSREIFNMVRRYRDGGGRMSLVSMVSYSIVFRHGVEQYLAETADAGLDAVLIPDLPLEEAESVESLAASKGLANVMLIAPTTPAKRQREIAKHSRGFIYFISIAGITGERDKLPEGTIQAMAELRRHTETPICVGFGISNAQTVAHVCTVADGAIVGSAIVHRLADAKGKPDLVDQIGGFVSELLEPLEG